MKNAKRDTSAASIIAMSIGTVRSIRGRSLAVDVRLVDAQWKVSKKSQRMGDVFNERGRVLVEVVGLSLDSQFVTVEVVTPKANRQIDLCAGETLLLDAVGSAAVEPSGWIDRLRKDVRANGNAGKRQAHAAVKSLQAGSGWF